MIGLWIREYAAVIKSWLWICIKVRDRVGHKTNVIPFLILLLTPSSWAYRYYIAVTIASLVVLREKDNVDHLLLVFTAWNRSLSTVSWRERVEFLTIRLPEVGTIRAIGDWSVWLSSGHICLRQCHCIQIILSSWSICIVSYRWGWVLHALSLLRLYITQGVSSTVIHWWPLLGRFSERHSLSVVFWGCKVWTLVRVFGIAKLWLRQCGYLSTTLLELLVLVP